MERIGIYDVRKSPGFHDEPLSGQRKGQRSIRLSDEDTQTAFAKRIGISVRYLCDLEHDQKIFSPENVQEFTKSLGYPHEQFVALASMYLTY